MLKSLAAAVAVALLLAVPASAAKNPNKLYADSRMVVRDRFSVEVIGKGPDVVLIPGLTTSRVVWKATADRLRATHRVHLVQIAGFAGEPARANATGEVVVPATEALNAYLAERRVGPVTMIGHSMGGAMTLYMAQRHPERLERAVVVDMLPFMSVMMGGGKATAESMKPMATQIRDAMARGSDRATLQQQNAMMATAETDRAQITDWGMASDNSVVSRAYYDLLTLDLRPGLGSVTRPITVVYADNVPARAPAGMMDRYYASAYKPLPGVTLRRIDASTHFVMLDQPAAFAGALDAVLARR